MNNIHLLIINYNYNKHLLKNISYFTAIESKGVAINIIDDQSLIGIKDLEKKFKNCYVTNYTKSNYNSINQINAVYFGLEHIKNIRSEDYVWLMDADDIPIMDDKILDMIKSKNKSIYLFSRLEKNQKITPVRKHKFWISRVTTSGIVIKKKLLLSNKSILTNAFFNDTWLDIRISCLASILNKETELSTMIICERVLHERNDSARYMNKCFVSLSRIIKAIFYKQFLIWQKRFY